MLYTVVHYFTHTIYRPVQYRFYDRPILCRPKATDSNNTAVVPRLLPCGNIKTEAYYVCTSSGNLGRQLYVETADPFQDQAGKIDGFSVSHWALIESKALECKAESTIVWVFDRTPAGSFSSEMQVLCGNTQCLKKAAGPCTTRLLVHDLAHETHVEQWVRNTHLGQD